jgi:hypothetical protein
MENGGMQFELFPKPALYAAINGLEELYVKGAGASKMALNCPSHVDLGLRVALSCAVAKQWPTAFVSETLSPDRAVLHLVALLARTPLEAIACHETKESNFTRLVEAAGRLCSSPLFLLGDDASEFEMTTSAIVRLAQTRNLKTVINERSRMDGSAAWRGRLGTLAGVSGLQVYEVAGMALYEAIYGIEGSGAKGERADEGRFWGFCGVEAKNRRFRMPQDRFS